MFKFIKNSSVFILLGILLILLGGCGAKNNQPAEPAPVQPASKVELTISAAASLTDALNEIQSIYENKNKNIKLLFNFGASGALQQQIEQGAPSDLFFSASAKNMQALIDKQLIDASNMRNLLINELVVVVPEDGKAAVRKIEDLSGANVKHVAIGEPQTVPAGGYAKEALTFAKLWEPLQPILVQGKDVRQVLAFVETGNAEAGFVYKTDALTSKKVKVAFSVDPASYSAVVYPAGIIKATKHSKEAGDFYTFLQTKEAQDIFVKFGFSIPK